MPHVLAVFRGSYAGDMDVAGFVACEKDHVDAALDRIRAEEGPIHMGCGDNQTMVWHDAADLIAAISVREIGDDELAVLKSLFPASKPSVHASEGRIVASFGQDGFLHYWAPGDGDDD